MSYGVDENGFTIKPEEEISTDIGNNLVATFGSTFDVSPESPDGQLIGVFSSALYDAWQMGELAYNSYVPSKTFGVGLDNLCELNEVERYYQRPTTATVAMSGDNGVVIPAGSLVADESGLEFETTVGLTLDSSTDNSVSVFATTAGANIVPAGTITVIVTEGISGWTGVNNPEAGIVGIDKETDPQLRNRRAKSVVTTGTSTNAAIYAALYKLGATYVVVIDNDSGEVVDGQPPNTFQCVVEGGSQVDIAQAIYTVKPYGIQAYGDIQTTVEDSKGYPKVIGFSRTSRVPVYVSVSLVRNKGASYDASTIVQANLIEYINGLNIGDDVIWSDLFDPINTVPYISVKSVTLGTSVGPTLTEDIVIGIKNRAEADEIQVVVTDITPT